MCIQDKSTAFGLNVHVASKESSVQRNTTFRWFDAAQHGHDVTDARVHRAVVHVGIHTAALLYHLTRTTGAQAVGARGATCHLTVAGAIRWLQG